MEKLGSLGDLHNDALFEKIMTHVGLNGRYQTRFNYMFNLLFIVFLAMPYLNLVLAMTIPEHWCHVPGRENTNLTLDEWKRLTIPRGAEDQGGASYSKCTMYDVNPLDNLTSLQQYNRTTARTVGCKYGWEYDHTWYTRTVVTQENWVCEKELYVTNTFVANRAGDVIGTFVFGQLGDLIGRRPVFFMTLLMLAIGRCLIVLTASNYALFLTVTIIGSVSQSAAFQSPMVLGMEMSAADKRAEIAMLQCLGWTAGICLMPMVAWLTGDWVSFLVITSAPCAAFCFTYKCFPESARWLAAKGKIKKCAKELQKMANMNKTLLPVETDNILNKIAAKKEKIYGVASLFNHWRLAKNTILIVYLWVLNAMTYYTLLLNVSNMSGNPFMNFFWQSLVELPGYIAGKILSDKYGRRWTQAVGFALVGTAAFIILFIITDPEMQLITVCLVIFIKLGITVTFYVCHLVAMETYPTCVRQSGTSMGAVLGSSMAILGPYIVYMGTTFDIRYPYIIMGFLFITGIFAALFLPETLHHRLPETLADAQNFGKDQDFWSLPRKQTRVNN
ncbi:hypothetical protein L9F63_008687, partial [Diploptera punctata]